MDEIGPVFPAVAELSHASGAEQNLGLVAGDDLLGA